MALNDIQFKHWTEDTGAAKPTHHVDAMSGQDRVGRMSWNHRSIRNIDVEPQSQRQGVATQMWQHGQSLAADTRSIPKPKHSADRTDQGDSWAKSVGGQVPRRLK